MGRQGEWIQISPETYETMSNVSVDLDVRFLILRNALSQRCIGSFEFGSLEFAVAGIFSNRMDQSRAKESQKKS